MESGNDDGLILNLHDDSWDLIMEGLELLLEKKKEYYNDKDDEVLLVESLIYHIQGVGRETIHGKIEGLRLKETEVSTLEIRAFSQGGAMPSGEKQSNNSGTAARKESLFEIVKRERKIETE
jgi:hypothetical protein